uniref:Uncharacterized protein n=1 Tax=Pseudomonas phage RVTF4 TaxID=3236931 RepID=A0AB39CCJ3_9VIRU
MSTIQSTTAVELLSDKEVVEMQKPLLRDAAYRALPRIKKDRGYDAGAYARGIEYFVTRDLARNVRDLGYSSEVIKELDEFLMELFIEVHKQEFIWDIK